MKKLFLFVCLTGSLMFAQNVNLITDPFTRHVDNCTRINFLGIVSVWSGSMDIETFNPLTNQWEVTASKPCGKGGGSWDWFWE